MKTRKPKPQCSKCGEMLGKSRHGKQRYCLNCFNAYMRATRVKHSDLPTDQRMKANTRAYARTYIRRGKMEKKPCQDCGSMFSECHHEDYTKPLEVKFLCRPCHMKRHKENSQKKTKQGLRRRHVFYFRPEPKESIAL